MPPKRIYGEKGGRRAPKGFVASTYETLTNAENAAFVRSIAIFGVRFPMTDFELCARKLTLEILGCRYFPF